ATRTASRSTPPTRTGPRSPTTPACRTAWGASPSTGARARTWCASAAPGDPASRSTRSRSTSSTPAPRRSTGSRSDSIHRVQLLERRDDLVARGLLLRLNDRSGALDGVLLRQRVGAQGHLDGHLLRRRHRPLVPAPLRDG